MSLLVQGTCSQSDPKFRNPGTQCMANVAAALCKHTYKAVHLWNQKDIDDILLTGDELYSALTSNIVDPGLLDVEDLGRRIHLRSKYFRLICHGFHTGHIDKDTSTATYESFASALRESFQQSSTAIVVLSGYAMAVMKVKGDIYWFDSHSRDERGVCSPNGTSVVIRNSDIPSFVHFVRDVAKSLNKQDCLFEITPVVIYETNKRGEKTLKSFFTSNQSNPLKTQRVNSTDSVELTTDCQDDGDILSAVSKLPRLDNEHLPLEDLSPGPVEATTLSAPVLPTAAPVAVEATPVPVIAPSKPVEATTLTSPVLATAAHAMAVEATSVPVIAPSIPVEATTLTAPVLATAAPMAVEATSVPVIAPSIPVEATTLTSPVLATAAPMAVEAASVPVIAPSIPVEATTLTSPVLATAAPMAVEAASVPVIAPSIPVEATTLTAPVLATAAPMEVEVTSVPVIAPSIPVEATTLTAPVLSTAAPMEVEVTSVPVIAPSIPVEAANSSLQGPTDTQALDIKNFLRPRTAVTDDQKHRLITTRKPEDSFKFPPKSYKDRRKPSGYMQRYCLHSWFTDHDYLAYSKAQDGLYCVACVLFPMPAHHGARAKKLITEPYTNWKDAKSDLQKHWVLQYHKDSEAKMKAFIHLHANPALRVDLRISSEATSTVAKNRQILTIILRCIEYCGRQGIALRGHRDDGLPTDESEQNMGNLKALVHLVSLSDEKLAHHLETCAKNATYTSKTTQNDFLECVKSFIQEEIVDEIKTQETGPFYGISADEVTDSSNWEQLGIVVRYVKDGQSVERLLEYVKCFWITGESIADNIIETLEALHLDPRKCRSQTYDGAGNMRGPVKGAYKMFQVKTGNDKAQYFHCASHELNLVLSHSCEVKEMSNMICAMQSLGIFFKYSPKRSQLLESVIDEHNSKVSDENEPLFTKLVTKTKVKPLCTTRWVERHTSFEDLHELYNPILETLERISVNEGDWSWDAKSRVEANGLLSKLSSSNFLVAFQVASYVFGFTKDLSILLQGTTMDIITAYKEVKLVTDTLDKVREDSVKEFKPLFDSASHMAKDGISIPRRCTKQTQQNNTPGNSPEEYFRRIIFVPFLDEMTSRLAEKFSSLSELAMKAMFLLPANLSKLSVSAISDIKEYYKEDMPSSSAFNQEVRLWQEFWATEENKPATLQGTLSHPTCTGSKWENMKTILSIVLTTPVTGACVERSNSTLKFVKNAFRSKMGEDRLNALLLMYIHRDIKLNYKKIIDMYATKHPRRMLLLNPLDS